MGAFVTSIIYQKNNKKVMTYINSFLTVLHKRLTKIAKLLNIEILFKTRNFHHLKKSIFKKGHIKKLQINQLILLRFYDNIYTVLYLNP
jgi:hypothetical protein